MTVALFSELLSPGIIISRMITASFVIMMALGQINNSTKLNDLLLSPLRMGMEKISHLLP